MVVVIEYSKEAHVTEEICGCLEVGFKRGVHTTQLWGKQHSQEENWGSLLIYTRNTSNEENHTVVLWVVRYEWSSGAQFNFKCYSHRAILVIRYNGGMRHFLQSKEWVTQGEPIVMIVYGIGVIPLIQDL